MGVEVLACVLVVGLCLYGASVAEAALDPAQLYSAAMNVAPHVPDTVAYYESLNHNAYVAGIDKDEPVIHGPEFGTTYSAQAKESPGQAYVETAAEAIHYLNMDSKVVGPQLHTYSVPCPDELLPEVMDCPYHPDNWPTCDPAAKYRSFDGTCNNLYNPLWGRSETPFERDEQPAYADGLDAPRATSTTGAPLPNPRLISITIHQDIENPMTDLSHMAMEFGQFISHDLQFNVLSTGENGSALDCCGEPNRPNCFPIEIPAGDPFFPADRTCLNFVRTQPTPNLQCTLGPRQQLNLNTHFLDGSLIYGSLQETADGLRTFTDGLLHVSTSGGKELLPTAPAGCVTSSTTKPCFAAGDRRVNQQPGLMSVQTIFHLEHNRIARGLAVLNPSWDDETLYQEARKIVIAEIQHITYNEYLPEILGETTMQAYDLKPKTSGFYTGYDSYVNPTIRNSFSTGAYRFGHSMIARHLPTYSKTSQTTNKLLKETFLRPDLVYDQGVAEITRGLTESASETVEKYVTDQVTNHLFEFAPGQGGDLAATNIQRGRDNGIPGYQVWRRHCSLHGQFSHSYSVKNALLGIYSSAEDIDLFTGGVSEIPLPGAKVGPTFACMIGKQFQRLKKGDRFFYENDEPTGFTAAQLNAVRQVTLSNVICRNTDIDEIQRKALRQVLSDNGLVDCDYIADIDLSAWDSSYTSCTPVNGQWGYWGYTPCQGTWILRYRLCNSPAPNECGQTCGPHPYQVEVLYCGSDNTYFGTTHFGQTVTCLQHKVEEYLANQIDDSSSNIDINIFPYALSAVTSSCSY